MNNSIIDSIDRFLESTEKQVDEVLKESQEILKKNDAERITGDTLCMSPFSTLKYVSENFLNKSFETLFAEYANANGLTDANVASKGIKNLEDFKKVAHEYFVDIQNNDDTFKKLDEISKLKNEVLKKALNSLFTEYLSDNGTVNSLEKIIAIIENNRAQMQLNQNNEKTETVLSGYGIGLDKISKKDVSLNLDKIDKPELLDEFIKNVLNPANIEVKYSNVNDVCHFNNTVQLPASAKSSYQVDKGSLLYISKILFEIAKDSVDANTVIYASNLSNKLDSLKKLLEANPSKQKDIKTQIENIATLFVTLNLQIALLETEQTKHLAKLIEYDVLRNSNLLLSLLSKDGSVSINTSGITYVIAKLVDQATNNLFKNRFNLSDEKLFEKYSAIGELANSQDKNFALGLNKYFIAKDQVQNALCNINFSKKDSQNLLDKLKNLKLAVESNRELIFKNDEEREQKTIEKIQEIIQKINSINEILSSHTKVYENDEQVLNNQISSLKDLSQNIDQDVDTFNKNIESLKPIRAGKKVRFGENGDIIGITPTNTTTSTTPTPANPTNTEPSAPDSNSDAQADVSSTPAQNSNSNSNINVNQNINNNQNSGSNASKPEDDAKKIASDDSTSSQTGYEATPASAATKKETAEKKDDNVDPEIKDAKQKLIEAQKIIEEQKRELEERERKLKDLEKKQEKVEKDISVIDNEIDNILADYEKIYKQYENLNKTKVVYLYENINGKFDDVIKNVSKELSKRKTNDAILNQLTFLFNYLLNNDEKTPETSMMVNMTFGDEGKIFNMMCNLKHCVLGLSNNLSKETAKNLLTISSETIKKEDDVNVLTDMALKELNDKFVNTVKQYKEDDIAKIKEENNGNQSAINEQIDKIERLYNGTEETKGLIEQVNNNSLYLIFKNIVITELLNIKECKEQNKEYNFSSKEINDSFNVVFSKVKRNTEKQLEQPLEF